MFRSNDRTGYTNIDEGYIRGLMQRNNLTQKELNDVIGRNSNYICNCFARGRMNEEIARQICDLMNGDWDSFRGIYKKSNSVFEEARALYEEPEEPEVVQEQMPVVLVKREEDAIEKLKKYLCDLYLSGTKMVNVLELMEKLQ